MNGKNIPLPDPTPTHIRERVAAIKAARSECTILTAKLQSAGGSRPVSLAITKLEEGCMWLGKELQRIGEENPGLLANPYPTSRDAAVPTIDPPAHEISGEELMVNGKPA